MDGQMRVCEPDINLFEECVHDPKAFAKFQALATPAQREAKNYFSTIIRRNYFYWGDVSDQMTQDITPYQIETPFLYLKCL